MNLVLLAAVLTVAAPVPERLPAEVDDAYALRFNPAGLGRLPGSELRLFVGRQEDRVRGDLGFRDIETDYGFGGYAAFPIFGTSALGIGFEVDNIDGDFQRLFVAGFGTGRGPVSMGFSYSTLWPREGDDNGFWTLGTQVRPNTWMSLGFSVRDVGENVFQRRYDTGLALRPHPRVTLGSRWRYEEGVTLNSSTLDLAFRGDFEPIDGVQVGGVVDLDGRVLLQFGLNLERLSASGQLDFDDGDVFYTAEAVLRSHRKPSLLPIRRVAVITLAGELKPDPTFVLLRGGFRSAPYGAVPLFLERLVNDDEVAGVFARIGPLSIGWATAQEVRAGLKRIKDSGRRVDCLLSATGDKSYFVASACSSITVPPPLQLEVNGVQATLLFVGEALERYGVEAEVYRRGEFKTAPETYTRSGLSRPQRKSLGTFLDQVQATLEAGIAEGRGLSADAVQKVLGRGVLTSSEAKDLKVVDQVMYPDEVERWVRGQYPHRVVLAAGGEALSPERPRWRAPPTIAIVHVDAAITSGESQQLPFGLGRGVGAQTLFETLERVRLSRAVRAVVLRVDSPGGSAFGSDIIARAVRKLAAEKPVIASFGDVAASGGYYVASGARAIYAEPTTLTGSIGVFSLRFSAETFLRRLGINAERLGPGVGSPSPYLSSTSKERAITAKGVEASYKQFLQSVAAGRRMDVKRVAAVAEGRVWTGSDALKRGLVDEIGGLVAALRRARLEAGLPEGAYVRLVNLPESIQPLPLVTQLAQVVGLAPDAKTPDLWPEGLKALIAPLLAVDSHRPGSPLPLAWLPVGLSVD